MISSSMVTVSTVDQNDRLLALTTDGGVTLWTQSDLLHRLLTAPALYNGNLVVGDSEGYMHWVNRKMAILWRSRKWTAPAS